MLHAGTLFTVQVKRHRHALRYETEHELAWIRQQENPLFLCTADPERSRVNLYSTWNRLNAFLRSGARCIDLIPGEDDENGGVPETAPDGSVQRILASGFRSGVPC